MPGLAVSAVPAAQQGLAALGLRWRLAQGTGPAAQADQAFLRQLFASTRDRELEALGAGSPLAQHFLTMQFSAREQSYLSAHPGAERRIIEHASGASERKAVGQLWVDVTSTRIDLLDISLLPPWRGHGIGGALLQALLAQVDNPARGLYARLGFAEIANTGPYLAMRWAPAMPPTIQTAAETLHEQA
jgi:GNAT superfamily N-acetyltransferase